MYALLVNVLLEYVEGSVWRRVIWHIREIGTGPMENLSRVIDIVTCTGSVTTHERVSKTISLRLRQ